MSENGDPKSNINITNAIEMDMVEIDISNNNDDVFLKTKFFNIWRFHQKH